MKDNVDKPSLGWALVDCKSNLIFGIIIWLNFFVLGIESLYGSLYNNCDSQLCTRLGFLLLLCWPINTEITFVVLCNECTLGTAILNKYFSFGIVLIGETHQFIYLSISLRPGLVPKYWKSENLFWSRHILVSPRSWD